MLHHIDKIIHHRRLFIGLAFAFCCQNARADLYDDYTNSKSKRPFVSFLARNTEGSSSKPGHSYVAVGVELDNGLRVYERIFGYYPKSDAVFEEVKAVFTKVVGDIKYKLPDVIWTVELNVPTDEAGHKAALSVMEAWLKNDPKYQLFANGGKNCSAFAGEVAEAIGLKVPSGAGSKFPVTFISELRALNKKP
ncbi:hypothetical protein SAMN02799622_05738 [Methylobacterium sp. UNC378MF]|uniref:hypothetical protein n=1 Tax=Methylobacterium sp. UNC378MF TaxID=1502748 RepID=UPI0008871500|nr:hypothetical protein [Methylobacterium sp. UNC378MF]SDA34240.1 hypothetical protein SAMN02799622_05738 [Methylobacterium sp. UNC378MF]